jgi:hypothetical protein
MFSTSQQSRAITYLAALREELKHRPSEQVSSLPALLASSRPETEFSLDVLFLVFQAIAQAEAQSDAGTDLETVLTRALEVVTAC